MDPSEPTKSNPWIVFASRVEKAVRVVNAKVKTTDMKRFASSLKAKKAYTLWQDHEIVAAYIEWSKHLPIKVVEPKKKKEGLRVRIIPPLPISPPSSRSVSPLREEPNPVQYDIPVHIRRKYIPKHIKTLVWNKYNGCENAEAKCASCRQERINIRNFHCGHVIAEANGGDMTINNLRPICAPCNLSMGTRSMNEFTSEFFGWIV